MNKGKHPFYIGGGMLAVYSLIILISNCILLTRPDAQITEGWLKCLYIVLPALVLVLFIVTAVLRKQLFYMALRGYTMLIFFLCTGVNLALTAANPEALRPMYLNLAAWSGIDLISLLGVGALWIIALFLFGCYLIWNLGFQILDDAYPVPYLVARTVSLSVAVFVWLPILARFGWISPPDTFPKPLFVLLCGLYYLIFLLVRMLAATSTSNLHDDENWHRQMSTSGLLFSTVIMAVLIIPYFKLIYFIPGVFTWLYSGVQAVWNFVTVQWWRALIAVVAFLFLANARSIVSTRSGDGTKTDGFGYSTKLGSKLMELRVRDRYKEQTGGKK